jgi:hypothetical protein
MPHLRSWQYLRLWRKSPPSVNPSVYCIFHKSYTWYYPQLNKSTLQTPNVLGWNPFWYYCAVRGYALLVFTSLLAFRQSLRSYAFLVSLTIATCSARFILPFKLIYRLAKRIDDKVPPHVTFLCNLPLPSSSRVNTNFIQNVHKRIVSFHLLITKNETLTKYLISLSLCATQIVFASTVRGAFSPLYGRRPAGIHLLSTHAQVDVPNNVKSQ